MRGAYQNVYQEITCIRRICCRGKWLFFSQVWQLRYDGYVYIGKIKWQRVCNFSLEKIFTLPKAPSPRRESIRSRCLGNSGTVVCSSLLFKAWSISCGFKLCWNIGENFPFFIRNSSSNTTRCLFVVRQNVLVLVGVKKKCQILPYLLANKI